MINFKDGPGPLRYVLAFWNNRSFSLDRSKITADLLPSLSVVVPYGGRSRRVTAKGQGDLTCHFKCCNFDVKAIGVVARWVLSYFLFRVFKSLTRRKDMEIRHTDDSLQRSILEHLLLNAELPNQLLANASARGRLCGPLRPGLDPGAHLSAQLLDFLWSLCYVFILSDRTCRTMCDTVVSLIPGTVPLSRKRGPGFFLDGDFRRPASRGIKCSTEMR